MLMSVTVHTARTARWIDGPPPPRAQPPAMAAIGGQARIALDSIAVLLCH